MRIVLLGVALLSAAGPAWAQDSWSSKPELPFGMCGHAMTSLNGYLYVAGGYTSVDYAYRLDPVTGLSWTAIAFLNENSNGSCAAAINGRVYVFGSQYYPPYSTGDAIQCYDPSADRWDTLSVKLGVPRGESAAVRHGASIYILGGNGEDGSAVEEFRPDPLNPLSATIAQRASLPVATARGAAGSIDGRIYFVYSWGSEDRATFEYDPGTDAWATRAAPPADTLDSPGSFVVQSRLYVTAGSWNDGPLPTFEYFPMLDRWTRRADLTTGRYRYYAAGAALNGRGYVTGGEGLDSAGDYAIFRACDEYTPPSFGAAPAAPSGVEQRIPGGPAVPEGGTIGTTVEFAATISDPEGDDVRLEIEAIPEGGSFDGEPTHLGALGASGGTRTASAVFGGGSWMWRARSRDVNGNASAWVDFGDPAAVDFVVDTVPPPTPAGLAPVDEDAPVFQRGGGAVTFVWTTVVDDRPDPVSYEIEVSYDSSFGSTSATAASGAASASIHLLPSNVDRYWRVRARDGAGNPGAWSAGYRFRVVFVDTVDHGAGDGWCAASAAGAAGAGMWMALLLAAGAAIVKRR